MSIVYFVYPLVVTLETVIQLILVFVVWIGQDYGIDRIVRSVTVKIVTLCLSKYSFEGTLPQRLNDFLLLVMKCLFHSKESILYSTC